MAEFNTFVTWSGVLGHVRAGGAIYYQAPLDFRPVLVRCHAFKNGKIRVYPPTRDADPFTADSGHLDRFKFKTAPAPAESAEYAEYRRTFPLNDPRD